MINELSIVWQILLGVAGITITFVAPLYILVLRVRADSGAAEIERSALDDAQQEISRDVMTLREEMRDSHSELGDELAQLHLDVRENAQRSERNQRHLHQLLLGQTNSPYTEDDGDGPPEDFANPHHFARHCPIPDECPFCDD